LVLGVLVAVVVVSIFLFRSFVDEMAEIGGTRARPMETRRGVGKMLAELSLDPLTGDEKPVTLSDLAGKVVVVNFWGTWCPPCSEEFPHLVELSKEFRQRPDFRLLLVSCAADGNEEVGELRAETLGFLERSEYEVPAYWDPGFKTRLAFHRVATLQGFPTTFILDRKGVIRGIWPGYNPSVVPEVRQFVVRLLSEETPVTPSGEGVARAP
jgi:thiol-disulfide isomerase/thioredoxin